MQYWRIYRVTKVVQSNPIFLLPSPLTPHPSPLTPHPSPLTPTRFDIVNEDKIVVVDFVVV